MYVDSHCHLDFEPLNKDLAGVLKRALDAGVDRVITIGTDLKSSENVAELHAANSDVVHYTVGVHPHEASGLDSAGLDRLAALAEVGACGIGEVGLDFHYDHSPRHVQRKAFGEQVALAVDVGLPLVVHSREAAPDTLEVLKSEKAWEVGGVVHCFSYDYSVAGKVLDLGFHIGITGVVTFKSAHEIADVVRKVPADKILIETDAPYLAPVPHRGKTNEPAYVVLVAEKVASLKSLDLRDVAAITSSNAEKLFRLADKDMATGRTRTGA